MMKEKFLLALFTFMAVAVFGSTVNAQNAPTILKAQTGRATRGAQDPNIKQGMKANDLNNPAAMVTKTPSATGPVTELKASSGSGSTDKNIKKDEVLNNTKGPKATAPRKKGGKTRGAAGCEVRLDNSTGWIIKIYVDGVYRGAMGAYDDARIVVQPGLTRVYARADFTNGTYKYWGPSDYRCNDNQYIDFRMVD
jgi:hypothetical protein